MNTQDMKCILKVHYLVKDSIIKLVMLNCNVSCIL